MEVFFFFFPFLLLFSFSFFFFFVFVFPFLLFLFFPHLSFPLPYTALLSPESKHLSAPNDLTSSLSFPFCNCSSGWQAREASQDTTTPQGADSPFCNQKGILIIPLAQKKMHENCQSEALVYLKPSTALAFLLERDQHLSPC